MTSCAFDLKTIVAAKGLIATRFCCRRGYDSTTLVAASVWKALEPIRNKCFNEFMNWLLNPGLGVTMITMVFWPGWIVVGAGYAGWWFLVG